MLTHLGAAPLVYGLDIETDTTPETAEELAAGYPNGGRGLDPRIGSVVNVGIATEKENLVFSGDEVAILTDLDAWLRQAEPGIIATWNGAGFDVPFLAHRFAVTQVTAGMRSQVTTAIAPKYQALPTSGGCHTMHWVTGGGHPHAHWDISYTYRDLAEVAGVRHSLKPVARAAGIEMIEVDRSRIDLLTPAEQDAYVCSDASGTRELALRWLAGARSLTS